MTRLRAGYIVIKTLRYSSWPLLLLLLGYLVTGFAMSGQYGFGKLLDKEMALAIHRGLHVPLGLLFGLHAVCATYLAMRRRRWLKK
jgi:hypothetical protein